MADLKYVKIRGVPLIDSSGNVDGVDISQFKSDFDSHHKLSTLSIDDHKDFGGKNLTGVGTLTVNTINLGADVNLYRSSANWLKTDDSLYVKGNIEYEGSLTARNIKPSTTNTYSLGDSTHKWKDINIAGNINVDGNLNIGGTVDGVDVSTHTHDGTAVGGPKIPLSNILISNTNWNNQSIFGMNTLEAKAINLSSDVFPVLDIERTTPSNKTGGIYGAARLIRKTDGTPQNGIGAGFYFAAPNGDNVSKHAGMFGGGLGDVTPGAEKGEIILSPSYAGQDPYQRKDFIVRAVSPTTAEAELNGNISISGEINVNGSRFFTEGNVTRLRANDSHNYMTFGFSDASGKPHLYLGPNILRPTAGSAAIDLGGSPSNHRFRNLYLSGNIFLDGNVQCQKYKSDTPFAFTTLSGAAQSIYVKGIKATSSYSGISSTAGVIEADEFRVTGGYILNDGNKLTPGGGLETTAGVHASKFNLNGKFTIEYNSTENSLDFVYV
jgi:hypothetical protein